MTEISLCGTITPDEEIVNVDFIKGKSGVLAPETEANIVTLSLSVYSTILSTFIALFCTPFPPLLHGVRVPSGRSSHC